MRWDMGQVGSTAMLFKMASKVGASTGSSFLRLILFRNSFSLSSFRKLMHRDVPPIKCLHSCLWEGSGGG